MKAYTYDQYGQPDVLKLVEVEKPIPKDNQVLVKVHATCINDWDYGFLLGDSLVNRLLSGLIKPKIKTLGCDIAGVVEGVGKDVTKFKPGDKVYGDLSAFRFGSFAEYVCVSVMGIEFMADSMTYDQAAAIPQAAMLAVQGLIDKGEILKNQDVLINGGGGGVGTYAVQLAKLYNATVTGVDRLDKHEMMTDLGFNHVIDFQKEDFVKNGKQYDLILDNKTTRSVLKVLKSLKPGGCYVTVGGNLRLVFSGLLMSPFIRLITKKKIKLVALKANKDLVYINQLYTQGKIKSIIDSHYNFDELVKAFEHYKEGKQKGKIVITVINEV